MSSTKENRDAYFTRVDETGLISNKINSFAGILNGTSNFIFSKMADEGLPFETALSLAQKEGFAEPDPTFDISGHREGGAEQTINWFYFGCCMSC